MPHVLSLLFARGCVVILIWKRRGLLALTPVVLLLASCGGLSAAEPPWLMLPGVAASLLVGGVVCVHYGTRWNRRANEHSFFFVPLQVCGWACLVLVALPTLLTFALAAARLAGLLPAMGNRDALSDAALATGSGVVLVTVVGVSVVLVRSARREPAPGVLDEPAPSAVASYLEEQLAPLLRELAGAMTEAVPAWWTDAVLRVEATPHPGGAVGMRYVIRSKGHPQDDVGPTAAVAAAAKAIRRECEQAGGGWSALVFRMERAGEAWRYTADFEYAPDPRAAAGR